MHKASTTIAVVGPSGRKLSHQRVETAPKQIISVLHSVPEPRFVALEEGTHSAWLYETLRGHVDELVVVGVRQQSRGPKDDKRDAFKLADELRTNSIKTRVFKDVGRYGLLRQLARAYRMQVQDSVRVQNRIHALYRSRGLASSAEALLSTDTRQSCIQELPTMLQPAADLLLREQRAIEVLRSDAHKQLLGEARRHPATKLLKSIPGIGEVRAAQLVPIIISPHRFRTKRQLWCYSGLGIVMRSSSDWVQDEKGPVESGHRAQDPRTESQSQRRSEAVVQGRSHDGHRPGRPGQSALPPLHSISGWEDQTPPWRS